MAGNDIPRFTREVVQQDGEGYGFGVFRKTALTRAVRIHGPFETLTADGNVALCNDGWLCIDREGFPYPCNTHEFESIYEPVSDVDAQGYEAERILRGES